MPALHADLLHANLARVQLLLCDVDGVLTDGIVVMGAGSEYKSFHIQDGFGMRLLQKCGIKVGWMSARPSDATRQRAQDLTIDFLHQDSGSKVEAAQAILSQLSLTWEDLCFVGDDAVDLGVLKRAGVGVSVPNGIAEARAMAHYVTRAAGGRGAVREVAELILKAKHLWAGLIDDFSS